MSLFSSIFTLNTVQSGQIKILDAAAFKEAIAVKGVNLIDVRTSKEYNSGHINMAINVDFFNRESFKKHFEKLDKNKPVYLYCRSGNRSQNAAKLLKGFGFNEIYDLKGGYLKFEKLNK